MISQTHTCIESYDDYCHWLSVPERVEFKLCVLTYRCLHGLGPDYFSSDFTRVSDLRPRQGLRSASTGALIVPATRHCTLGDRPGFSRHWRQAVELTARRHHHCNISVDFSAQTENIFISSLILRQCRHVTTGESAFSFIVLFSGFHFLVLSAF